MNTSSLMWALSQVVIHKPEELLEAGKLVKNSKLELFRAYFDFEDR